MSEFYSNELDDIMRETQIELIRSFKIKPVSKMEYFGLIMVTSEFILARYSKETKDDPYISYCDAHIAMSGVKHDFKDIVYLLISCRNNICHRYGHVSTNGMFRDIKNRWNEVRDLLRYLGCLPNNHSLEILMEYCNQCLDGDQRRLTSELIRLHYKYNSFNVNRTVMYIERDILTSNK